MSLPYPLPMADEPWFTNEDYGWSCLHCGSLMPASERALGAHLAWHGMLNSQSRAEAISRFVSPYAKEWQS